MTATSRFFKIIIMKKLVRFAIGSAIAVGLVIGADVVLNKTLENDCTFTTEFINKIGVWEKHNSYDDYETLFWNGVIQRDSDSIMLYYIVPFNSNGELLDTVKFNSTQIKGNTNCN